MRGGSNLDETEEVTGDAYELPASGEERIWEESVPLEAHPVEGGMEGSAEEGLEGVGSEMSVRAPALKTSLWEKMQAIGEQSSAQRILAATALVSVLWMIVEFFGSKGMAVVCVLSQMAMYQEICSVVESHHKRMTGQDIDREMRLQKHWWFAAALILTSGRALVKTGMLGLDLGLVELVGYFMAAAGLILAVCGMEMHSKSRPGATPSKDVFKMYLGEIAASLFAILFCVAQSSFWIYTLQSHGMGWLLFSLLLVIVNDTMAYIFGKTLGNTKLLPNLSPGKTWEGFVGAALSTLIVSVPLMKLIAFHQDAKHALVLAAFASIIAPFGGFLASAVKRAHSVKDFGDFIPGHGGVMDRLDCHVVMAPFCYLYLKNFSS